MSIEVDVDHVKEVRLADGEDGRWHQVAGNSFEIVGVDQGVKFNAGGGRTLRIQAAWAAWAERDEAGDRQVFCPLAAIQAVSYGWKK